VLSAGLVPKWHLIMTIMTAPLLADFAVRLAFGLATAMVLVPWRAVPPPFFRTQAQIALGVLVLAALDQARAGGTGIAFWTIVTGAVLAYISSVAWGLGLPRLSVPASALCAVSAVLWLIEASPSGAATEWALLAASRASSGFLLGAVLCSMLLGHYYLTAPAMTIDPLKRSIALVAIGLVVRAVLAVSGFAMWRWGVAGHGSSAGDSDALVLFIGRFGMGFLAAGIATYMTWKTAQIRSTQSATGILYIAMIFVCFGELMSLVLASRYGVSC
jgi:hypothetical protein